MLTLSRTCQCHHCMRHRGDMGHPTSGMGGRGIGGLVLFSLYLQNSWLGGQGKPCGGRRAVPRLGSRLLLKIIIIILLVIVIIMRKLLRFCPGAADGAGDSVVPTWGVQLGGVGQPRSPTPAPTLCGGTGRDPASPPARSCSWVGGSRCGTAHLGREQALATAGRVCQEVCGGQMGPTGASILPPSIHPAPEHPSYPGTSTPPPSIPPALEHPPILPQSIHPVLEQPCHPRASPILSQSIHSISEHPSCPRTSIPFCPRASFLPQNLRNSHLRASVLPWSIPHPVPGHPSHGGAPCPRLPLPHTPPGLSVSF